MSIFSDYLNQVREKRNMKIVEMAGLCNLETSTVYRWCHGKRTPSSHQTIDLIADRMNLNFQEKEQLEQAYLKTIKGSLVYENYETINQLLQFLNTECQSMDLNKNDVLNLSVPGREKDSFQDLSSHAAILMEVQKTFMTTSADETIYFKIHEPFEGILSLITNNVLLYGPRKIEIILCISSNSALKGNPTFPILKMLCEIFLYSKDIDILLFNQENDILLIDDNWMFTEESSVEFNQLMQTGIVTTYREWIHDRQSAFHFIRSHSDTLGEKKLSMMDYVDTPLPVNSRTQIYEYMPCVSVVFDYDLLDHKFFPDLPGREELIRTIIDTYYMDENSPAHATVVASEAGLRTFMETGILSVYPYPVYEPFTLEERKLLIRRLIHLIHTGVYTQYFHKYQIIGNLPMLSFQLYDDIANPYVIIFIIQNDLSTDRIIFKDPNIIQCFRNFFDVIGHPRYSYSKNETIEIIEQILEEY